MQLAASYQPVTDESGKAGEQLWIETRGDTAISTTVTTA